jgi:hypothetical protein
MRAAYQINELELGVLPVFCVPAKRGAVHQLQECFIDLCFGLQNFMLTFRLGVGPDVGDRLVYLCLVNAVLAIPDAKRESDGIRGSESRPLDPDSIAGFPD